MFQSVILSVCMTVVYFVIYPQFKAEADQKINILGSLSLGWVYLSAFVLRLGATVNGVRLGMARLESKVDVPDQHVYKVMGASGSSLGYVLMETEGEHGAFNRAQRAVQNYVSHHRTRQFVSIHHLISNCNYIYIYILLVINITVKI